VTYSIKRKARRRRRVVVTGLGAITPVGVTQRGLWAGIRARKSAVRSLTRFDPSEFRSHIAAEVRDFVPEEFLDRKRARRLDRFGQFAVVSAQMAVLDAELRLEREDRERIGSMMGSALAGVAYAEEQLGNFLRAGVRAVDPMLALTVFGGAASCNIAIEFGLRGPNMTNGMSCAAGAIAIGEAFHQIREDYADIMLCGGAEAPLAPLCYGAFALIRAMSTRNDDPEHACRPFDRTRDGFVMGEGAAVLVLEERERALARGAKVYAEVIGYGLTNDGYHMTAPLDNGSQAGRAIELALTDAKLAPGEVQYLNAHGSSTLLNDPTETRAIKHVFGTHAERLRISGTKGYYGHALGASGAIEAAICAQTLMAGWLPPTLNLESPDPECDLRYVRGEGCDAQPEHIISTSFGFGGINAVLAFRRAG
jgi:3-oxoacyl-[acyl-carrier-protein] synthase II